MQWVNIYQFNKLIQKGLYDLKYGQGNRMLIWDNESGKYVGHIEDGRACVEDDTAQRLIELYSQELDSSDWTSSGKGW